MTNDAGARFDAIKHEKKVLALTRETEELLMAYVAEVERLEMDVTQLRQAHLEACEHLEQRVAQVERLQKQIRNMMGLSKEAIELGSQDSGKTIEEIFGNEK